ncbi:uncharacterized protein M6B38_374785 [Iris pallida]|uniref:Uncharacterized protein n=1 Tax=Iris pallida TaxID=29817 RepID=A0AAX6GCH1_IRIPA|nr:uncharacterized protein M6B38_374785 [Iris pallida]
MKASLKFREDQKPLAKAKVPISILGLPFLSGVCAGETKELRLDLSTAFDSGPSLRASYRPNDPSAPFAVSLRTGVGSLGSPLGAPMSMTAEFGLGGANASPSFIVMFKPRLGDFSFRRVTTSSPSAKKEVSAETDVDASAVWVEKVGGGGGWIPARGWGVGDLVSGVEVTARTVLPLRSSAEVRFKWGVRVPPELRTAFDDGRRGGGGVPFGKLPLLVMSKISVVHVEEDKREADRKMKEDDVRKGVADVAKACMEVKMADVAKACMEVKKQLKEVQAENGSLRKSMEELKGRFHFNVNVGGHGIVADFGSSGGTRKPPEGSGSAATVATGPTKDEVNEELKKALMGATGGGAGK